MTEETTQIVSTIATELQVGVERIAAAVRLLDDGATVPFIARYRKEATQDLNDTELRKIAQRLSYLRDLAERRTAVLSSISEQDLLTPALEKAILEAKTKTRLEDLYLPFRPKRRTKAHLAKEAGLAPLADTLLQDETAVPEACAEGFINVNLGIETIEAALEGARQILMERFAEDPDLLAQLRQSLWQEGVLTAKAAKKPPHNKFADYEKFSQAIRKIPSHRVLALFRGRKEQALTLALTLPEDTSIGEQTICHYFQINAKDAPAYAWLLETVRLAWSTKLWSKLELELFNRLREMADEDAIDVFAKNLRDLLLAAPAGAKVIMGLDPGIRTGVKGVVVDATGRVLDSTTVFPLPPQSAWHDAVVTLAKLAMKHRVDLISVGNGTGSRETERLVAEMIKMYPDLTLTKVLVSEAGASVYSASELAAQEFPDMDVSLRGAVSIARRLQDPLAELVKIEPKSIGVGQYQHDVNQMRLAHSLDAVVEDCVNAVGVDMNRASAALLSHVSGLSGALAKQLVQYRDEHGAFQDRESLKQVPRMGAKAFQQAAGFLRVTEGTNPLDVSGVHPESYPIVERMVQDSGLSLSELMGNSAALKALDTARYVSEDIGLVTVQDIIAELEKPGRDPRPMFKTVSFKEGVDGIEDLAIGMVLEGVVSNVTHFGAFVDLGVHQDGLIHVSAMTDRFIRDPREMVKTGDIVTVKVTEVDKDRRRIGLTMKLQEAAAAPASSKKEVKALAAKVVAKKEKSKPRANPKKERTAKTSSANGKNVFNTAMADALSKLKREMES
ncbi:MAG: RNA-binding transcriptional accessory protein [Gammaproteobacteria bacterium]|nr:RNA-binding transcriptional accessory protein [Gammaproteobacteria bacterium]